MAATKTCLEDMKTWMAERLGGEAVQSLAALLKVALLKSRPYAGYFSCHAMEAFRGEATNSDWV